MAAIQSGRTAWWTVDFLRQLVVKMSSASIPKNDPTEVGNLAVKLTSTGISDNDPTKTNNSAECDHSVATDESDDDCTCTCTCTCDADGDNGSYEPAPLVLDHDALKHVGTHFVPGSHGACIDVSVIQRDRYYEKRLLHFEDGWTCLGRFVRNAAPLAKYESELATMKYVRKHTTIPVAEVYFSNFSENHPVGAPFTLQEHIEGEKTVVHFWYSLSLDHKLDLTKQLAKVYGQLAGLKFDTMGSLTADGKVGPLLHNSERDQPLSEQPLTNISDYMNAFLKEDHYDRLEGARALYPAIKEKIAAHLAENAANPTLNAPFRLTPIDISLHTVLGTQDESGAVTITGLGEWDWAHTGPLYYLINFPEEMLDLKGEPEENAEKKILRKQFVRTLADCFPKGSVDREAVKKCFREKNYLMDGFFDTFMQHAWDEEHELREVKKYLSNLDENADKPHGFADWESDSELESDEDEES